jgi:molybdopterin/thiamine biosynthesis adenylyltransferase
LASSAPSILDIATIDEDIHERQKRISGWNQEKIRASKILVAGAGALGNEIVKDLVQLGIGHLCVVDNDRVVRSNVNRCVLFRLADAEQGQYKALALAKRAKELNPAVDIEPIVGDLEAMDCEMGLYRDSVLAFGALDNLDARIQLNICCYYNKLPLIDGGIDGFLGQVQVVVPPRTPCLQCGMTERDKEFSWMHVSCGGQYEELGERKMPALTTIASIVAGVQVNEALKILMGHNADDPSKELDNPLGSSLAGKRLFFSGYTNVMRIHELERNPFCDVCSIMSPAA